MSKKKIAQIVLLVTVLLATISLVEATANYVSFHEAVTRLKLQIIDMQVTTNTNQFNLTIQLQVDNPTSYSGLQLAGILGDFYYEGEPHNITTSPGKTITGGAPYEVITTRLWELPTAEVGVERQVLGYSTIDIPMRLDVRDDYAKPFLDYLQEQGGHKENIRWQLNFRVALETPLYIKELILEYQFTR